MTTNNYSDIVTLDDKTYLYDKNHAEREIAHLGLLQILYDDALALLRDGGYATNLGNVHKILNRGREGLLEVAWSRADGEADRLQIQLDYIRETWRENERKAITHEQWEQADNLCGRNNQLRETASAVTDTDLVELEGRFVIDTEAVAKRINAAYMVEVTDDVKKTLAELQGVANAVKKAELTGVNALDIIDWLVHQAATPDESEMYRRIIFNRHEPGKIHDRGIDALLNAAAAAKFHLTNPIKL